MIFCILYHSVYESQNCLILYFNRSKERKASIYENYGGALIEQENKYGYDNGKYWDVQNIGATLGRYEQVRTYVNEDKEITKITWNFVYKAGVTYKFTLTVCDFTITPPAV